MLVCSKQSLFSGGVTSDQAMSHWWIVAVVQFIYYFGALECRNLPLGPKFLFQNVGVLYLPP